MTRGLKFRIYEVYVAKTKALISFGVFAYAKIRFSHDAAQFTTHKVLPKWEPLRERLRTHKVFTKDQCFYLNYRKFHNGDSSVLAGVAGKKWKLKFTANVKGNKGGKGVKKNREPFLPGQGHPSQGQSGRFTLICLYNNTPQPP